MIPTVFGEKAVLRLLASGNMVADAETFGMNQAHFEQFSKMLEAPNGMIYITGPTGSGKTTTLYMALQKLSNRKVNIATIEDPVEWNIPRVNQCQVNTVAGLTFERGLRSLLRQDPDIIMVVLLGSQISPASVSGYSTELVSDISTAAAVANHKADTALGEEYAAHQSGLLDFPSGMLR